MLLSSFFHNLDISELNFEKTEKRLKAIFNIEGEVLNKETIKFVKDYLKLERKKLLLQQDL